MQGFVGLFPSRRRRGRDDVLVLQRIIIVLFDSNGIVDVALKLRVVVVEPNPQRSQRHRGHG
jgi:hypothetical protein